MMQNSRTLINRDVRPLLALTLTSVALCACSGDSNGAPPMDPTTVQPAVTDSGAIGLPDAAQNPLPALEGGTQDPGQGAQPIDAGTQPVIDAGTQPASDAGMQPPTDVDGAATDAAVVEDAGAPEPSTGVLPPITDPLMPGPFTATTTQNVGPGDNYTVIAPEELGQGGVKHPILIWGPGAGASPDMYQVMLDHIAAHGFVVVSYNSTPDGPELNTAIDWITEESQTQGSPYFEKVDPSRIAMGGQSAGSLATFNAGGDERLTTTLHINGGLFDPSQITNLANPALFICGDDGGDGLLTGDLARPNCDTDFMNAKVPVWYGIVVGSSHTTVIDIVGDDPLKHNYNAAMVGWLRWQIGSDETMKALFVGDDCGYCKQPDKWEVMQKGLN